MDICWLRSADGAHRSPCAALCSIHSDHCSPQTESLWLSHHRSRIRYVLWFFKKKKKIMYFTHSSSIGVVICMFGWNASLHRWGRAGASSHLFLMALLLRGGGCKKFKGAHMNVCEELGINLHLMRWSAATVSPARWYPSRLTHTSWAKCVRQPGSNGSLRTGLKHRDATERKKKKKDASDVSSPHDLGFHEVLCHFSFIPLS